MMRRLHGGMKALDADNGTWQDMSSNELAQRLDNLTLAAAAADENGSVENCWDTIQSQTLAVLGRAPRHLQPALREGPPAKSLHRPPHRRRRRQSSILPLPPPCATASARDAERTDGPQGYGVSRVRGPYRLEEQLLCYLLSAHQEDTEKTQILQRWADNAIARPPQVKTNTQMVRQLHDGMMARVTDNAAVSEAFAETNGVKQGCVLAPTLFSLMFSAMLMDTYRDEHPGIRIAYRTDGHLLNQRRMHFHSRLSATTVHELLFADDCALNTTSEEAMQRSTDQFSAACAIFGLVINTQTTVVMHQPPPNSATAPNAPPQISVNGNQLQVVENFPYLYSTLFCNTKIDDKVPRRIP
nr:unnamed protein product [Spirometra erinaceieuropaei]